MSEIEIKQMQEKINAGILLARKRLIEKTKKEDGELKCTPNIGRISICLDGMSSVLYRAHVV